MGIFTLGMLPFLFKTTARNTLLQHSPLKYNCKYKLKPLCTIAHILFCAVQMKNPQFYHNWNTWMTPYVMALIEQVYQLEITVVKSANSDWKTPPCWSEAWLAGTPWPEIFSYIIISEFISGTKSCWVFFHPSTKMYLNDILLCCGFKTCDVVKISPRKCLHNSFLHYSIALCVPVRNF